ncbi:MAG: MBL fold metallo-hydrolase [Patescibacteria group bacterium]|jgi:glyoxylase-like metal-dependent hydrolase (beta-lactamase superfamily II)
MAEVKILIEGYTTADFGGEKTTPTITLIRDGNNKIIVDPGVLENQKMLADKLKEEGLSVDDINIVFITHSHIDHYRNIGMFPEAKTLEFYGLWDKNMVEDWQEQFSEDIKIIKTPGHSYDGLTLLVKTSDGVVAVCGDVFWKRDFPVDDEYATDKEKLKQSRKVVLESSDWIIPGHAGMYKIK